MSELLRRIQLAQVQAGEDAVVEDLRRKGLLSPRPRIAMRLDEYEQQVEQFCIEKDGSCDSENTLRRLYLGQFILWLRNQQKEINDGTTSNEA